MFKAGAKKLGWQGFVTSIRLSPKICTTSYEENEYEKMVPSGQEPDPLVQSSVQRNCTCSRQKPPPQKGQDVTNPAVLRCKDGHEKQG